MSEALELLFLRHADEVSNSGSTGPNDPAKVTPHTNWDYLSSLLPEGKHAVATRRQA